MKKLILILVVIVIVLGAAITGAFVATNSSKPFQDGVIEEGYYFNAQAKLMFLFPTGWNGELGYNPSLDDLMTITSSGQATVRDFSAMNPLTGSNVQIIYAKSPLFQTLESIAEASMEQAVIEANEQGMSIERNDSFQKTIAGKDCQVEVVEMEIEGLTFHAYCCFFTVEEYTGLIVIVPNELVDSPDSFDKICKSFMSLE